MPFIPWTPLFWICLLVPLVVLTVMALLCGFVLRRWCGPSVQDGRRTFGCCGGSRSFPPGPRGPKWD